jgi:hypothetical protein
MTAQDSSPAPGSFTETWLNIVYPGLAQLARGRRAAAACIAVEALALIVLFLALPAWRVLTVVGMTVLTALSILDAVASNNTD